MVRGHRVERQRNDEGTADVDIEQIQVEIVVNEMSQKR